MIKDIDIIEFLKLYKNIPVLDVRSPVEFMPGHIPGSINIPLFTNEQRAQIGTIYKQQGTDAAVKLGESFANPQIPTYYKLVERAARGSKKVLITCFRGGLRSKRFAELLAENGYEVYRLQGGYKSYRKNVYKSFSEQYSFIVLGGMTGSGKTDILTELEKRGEQIIDLEKLANHRGSVFGAIGQGKQPTTEQFENELFEKIALLDKKRMIWIEDESQRIGTVYLPEFFFKQIRTAPIVVLELDIKLRALRLSRDYISDGIFPLIEGIKKIIKKLGNERAGMAEKAIKSGDYYKAATLILNYYDRSYFNCFDKKMNSNIMYFTLQKDDPAESAALLQKKFIFDKM